MVVPADTEDRCNPAQFVARSVTKYVAPQRFGSSRLSQLVLSTGIGENANVWQPYGVVPTQASRLVALLPFFAEPAEMTTASGCALYELYRA
jgi:hypothetical protein